MTVKTYLISLPERLVRSALGFGAGVAHEVGEVVLPEGVRRGQLYQNLVDATLRYLIEEVGGVEGVYSAAGTLPDDFLARRTAGNAVEMLGIVAFRASPVWILAALADLCGVGRHLIPELADALKAQGLLERTHSSRPSISCWTAWNAPRLGSRPLSTRRRSTWRDFDTNGRLFEKTDPAAWQPALARHHQPPVGAAEGRIREAEQVDFETSSLMAVSAAQALPGGLVGLPPRHELARCAPARCSRRRCCHYNRL